MDEEVEGLNSSKFEELPANLAGVAEIPDIPMCESHYFRTLNLPLMIVVYVQCSAAMRTNMHKNSFQALIVAHQAILFVVTAMLNLKTGICSTVIISELCCTHCTPYAMYALHSDTQT